MQAFRLDESRPAAGRPRLHVVPPSHGPSRVRMESGTAFSYQGADSFWTQILGKWESRHDRQSPSRAHNWVLLMPCSYLAHFDTRRQVVVFEPKGSI